MSLTDFTKTQIENFFSTLSPVAAAFPYANFAYVAVRHEGRHILIKGAVQFSTATEATPPLIFESPHVRAALHTLKELNISARDLLEALMKGSLKLPDCDLVFPSNESGLYSFHSMPLHLAGLQNQQRMGVLQIGGNRLGNYFDTQTLDWELKAAKKPYDTLQDLFNEFSLGQIPDSANVEFIRYHVAAIDFSSKVQGTTAWPTVILANGLNTDDVTLGYRVFDDNKIVDRLSASGAELTWVEKNGFRHGTIEIQMPQKGLLHCVASYAGVAQHFGWLTDPSRAHNVRRAIYEEFDNNIATLEEITTQPLRKGNDGRDLEAAVSWLAWMLGFSVAFLGGTKRMQEAPDLIFVAPNGNIAVVECTTGLLKAENKLSILHNRTQAVRRAVDTSGNQHLHVMAVIITTKTREEVAPDIEQAEKLGILVMCRAELEAGILRTAIPSDANQLYLEAEQSVEAAREKHSTPQMNLL